jgi:hypothetical protein
MKGVWKWISLTAGIFLVMACLGLVAAVGFGGRFMMMDRNLPLRMPFGFNRGINPMNPGFGHGIGPWMMPGGRLIGIGFVLVILVLLVLAGVGLFMALRKRPQAAAVQVGAAAPAVGSPPAAAPTQAVEPAAPTVVPALATSPCHHCGQPVQAGWVACPYCGEKI